MKYVSFNTETAKGFIATYNKAKRDSKESFIYDGNEFVIGYAYYLIQYLVMNHIIEGEFNKDKRFIIKGTSANRLHPDNIHLN